MSRYLAVLAVAALGLTQCSPKPADAPASAASAAVSYAYDVDFELTPAAAVKLKQTGAKVSVTALYFGHPTPEGASQAGADYTIHFNMDTVPVTPENQTVHMTGAGIDLSKLPVITQRKPLVLVDAVATVKPGGKNLLTCADFEDYITVAQEQPVKLVCDVK